MCGHWHVECDAWFELETGWSVLGARSDERASDGLVPTSDSNEQRRGATRVATVNPCESASTYSASSVCMLAAVRAVLIHRSK